jgi:hypothetical protein
MKRNWCVPLTGTKTLAESRAGQPNVHCRLLGTFAPERRASDSPIAIACLRLRTVLRERPLLSLPRFISCIALLTFLPLALPYLRAISISYLPKTRAGL